MSKPRETLEYEVTVLPDAQGKRVLVLPGAFYGDIVQMFAECGYERASSVNDADLVCFTGGVDVNPDLYNQEKIRETQFPDVQRDTFESEVFDKCVLLGIPMFGICRGAQFLHVKNKGELWQHVEGHGGQDHLIYDCDDGVTVVSNSIHHQMIALTQGTSLEVIAVCKTQVSKKFLSSDLIIDLTKEGDNNEGEVEIEAGVYHDTKCFFVQGHPEIGNAFFKSWAMCKLQDFLEEWSSSSVEDDVQLWREAALM